MDEFEEIFYPFADEPLLHRHDPIITKIEKQRYRSIGKQAFSSSETRFEEDDTAAPDAI